MRVYLQKLFQGIRLSQVEAEAVMDLMMEGKASSEEIAAFLGALASRGETKDELVGCARSMRQHSVNLPCQRRDLIDVCGTGGDGAETFNISTTNALVLAASGLGVVKHGNRAVSSKSGSADVLEALGVAIEQKPEEVAQSVDQNGFGFLFAPMFHPAMKHVGPTRRALGVRTIFNLLGPLANPAPVKRQILGVFAEKWVEPMAMALHDLGTEEALVVWGEDGLDELSLSTTTRAIHLRDGKLTKLQLRAADFGLQAAPLETLRGGDKVRNAELTLEILQGKPGPMRDVVILNTAAALVVGSLAKTWREGAQLAASLIDSGAALQTLEKLRAKQ